jgi:hypothetical protein
MRDASPRYPQALRRLETFNLAGQTAELSPRVATAHAVRADPRPTVGTASARSYRNRVRRALRPLAVRADPRPAVGTAAARRDRHHVLRALRSLAVRADPRPTVGTAAAGRYRHRALRTLRRLAVRAVCRPTIRTAAARPGRYRRRLAIGCAGSQHQRANQDHAQRRERCAVRARLARETRTRRKHAPDIGGEGISAMAIANLLKKSFRGTNGVTMATGAIASFGSNSKRTLNVRYS